MKKIILALFVLMATTAAVFAQSDLQALAVVKYNKSETITVKQLKSRCEFYEKQAQRKFTNEEKKQVLDALIDEKLILQAAAKAGVSIPDSNVNQYFLQQMAQQFGQMFATEKDLADFIQAGSGLSMDDFFKSQLAMTSSEYKNYLKNSLIVNQYVLSARQTELQKVAATDEQIRQFYESNKTQFVWNDMMKMFMIIVPKGSNADEAKVKCNELRGKLADKKLTTTQIETQGNTETSGYQAGMLLIQKTEPYALQLGMTYNNLLWVFDQKEGFISDVQDANTEYRVIKVEKKYGAKMLGISDIIQPESTITVYDYIRGSITQQLQMQALGVYATEMSKELNKPEYVDRKKTGDALTKLLDWGN